MRPSSFINALPLRHCLLRPGLFQLTAKSRKYRELRAVNLCRAQLSRALMLTSDLLRACHRARICVPWNRTRPGTGDPIVLYNLRTLLEHGKMPAAFTWKNWWNWTEQNERKGKLKTDVNFNEMKNRFNRRMNRGDGRVGFDSRWIYRLGRLCDGGVCSKTPKINSNDISRIRSRGRSRCRIQFEYYALICQFADYVSAFQPERQKGHICGSFTAVRVSSPNAKCESNRKSAFHSFEVRTFPISVLPVGDIIGRDLILSYVKLLP